MPSSKCDDAEAALVEALTAAGYEPLTHRLYEVEFGRFATAGTGWFYRLRFIVEVGVDEHPQEDLPQNRTDRIVRAWSAEVEKYRQADAEAMRERI